MMYGFMRLRALNFCSVVKIHFCLSPICAKLRIGIAMPRKNFKQRQSKFAGGFRISNGPVVRPHDEREREIGELHDILEVPRIHGAPMLFATPRDPHTIFAYWNVDWLSIFAKSAPVDRQVHLRIYRADAVEEKSVAVEPMGGNCYITVSRPGGSYHVEIGYYQPADVWNSIATSDEVAMPPDDFADETDVDLATIPLHLSFQQLLDLFGASNRDDLAEIISRFQKRASSGEKRRQLSTEAREIFRAMDLSLSETAAARRAFAAAATSPAIAGLRKRAKALLGSGLSSPSREFGESSWASAGS
jgi:hypothetical protein